MSERIVILSGARTPVGKLAGSLASFPATALGGFAIAAALERSGPSGGKIDYVYMGQVLQAGAGQTPSRQVAVSGGVPMPCPPPRSTRCACPGWTPSTRPTAASAPATLPSWSPAAWSP